MTIKRLLTAFRADALFQFKHGFYWVYLVLSLVYIVILSFFSTEVLDILLPILIFIDPAVLGMFFVGGMLLLEREQGILAFLNVTPLKTIEYIISKIFSLSLISVFPVLLITFSVYRSPVNWGYLIAGTLLVSIFFTLAGMLISRRSKSVNEYMVRMAPFSMVFGFLCLVLIPNRFIPPVVVTLLSAVPSVGGFNLLLSSFSPLEPLIIIISLAGLVVFDALLLIYTTRVFSSQLILEENGTGRASS